MGLEMSQISFSWHESQVSNASCFLSRLRTSSAWTRRARAAFAAASWKPSRPCRPPAQPWGQPSSSSARANRPACRPTSRKTWRTCHAGTGFRSSPSQSRPILIPTSRCPSSVCPTTPAGCRSSSLRRTRWIPTSGCSKPSEKSSWGLKLLDPIWWALVSMNPD